MIRPVNALISSSNKKAGNLRVIYGRRAHRECIDRKTGFLLVKRIIDILLSLFITVFVLSWLLPAVSLAILICSGRPVFFVQKRTGRGGRSFRCYKFRTLVLNDDADKRPCDDGDERITLIGRFLRKTNIDELPQFFNVLNGTMSIVGPRPHMLSDCDRFSSIIHGYKFRNLVKPGITGLAQIKGYHGPAPSRYDIEARYYWDCEYVRRMTPATDCMIVIRTVLRLFLFFSFTNPDHRGDNSFSAK